MDTSQLFISRGVKVAVHVREGDVYPGDVLRGVVEVRCGYRHRDEPTALASLAVSFKCLERAVIGGLMSVDVNPEAKKSVYLNDRIQLIGTPPQGGATWLSPGASLAAAPPPHAPHGGEEANNTQHRHHHSHSSRTNGSLQADDLDYPHLQELCHAALPMEEGVYTFPFFVVLPYTIPPSLKVYDAGNARCALWYVLCADLCLVSGKRLVSEEVPVEVKPLPLPLHRWVETMEGIQRQREEAERARMNGRSSSNKKKGDEDGSRPQTSSSSPPPLQNAPMEGSITTATATDYYGPDISMEALRREERTLRHTLRIDELYPRNIMHEWRQADYEHRDGQNRARIRRALSLLAPINGTTTTTSNNNNNASATPPSSVPRQQRLDAATPGSSTSRSSKKMSVPVCRPEDGPMMQGNYVPELNDVQSRQAFFDRASLTSAQQGLPGGELEPYDCEMERCSHIFVVPLRFGIFTGSRMIPLRVDMMSAVLTPGQKHQLSLNLTIDNSKGKADIGKVELHLVTRITVHSKYEEYSFDRSHPVVRMGDVVPKGIIATLPTIHVPVPEDLPISVRTHGCSKATFLCVRMASLTKPVHYHRSVEMELLVVGGVDLLGQSRRLERWSCNFGEMRFPHKEENKAYMVDQTAFCSPKVMVLLTVKEALQRFALAATNSRRFSSADTIKHMKATERPTSSSESQEPFRNEPFDWHRPTFVPRPVEPSSHHVDPHPNPLTFASSLPFEFDGSASD